MDATKAIRITKITQATAFALMGGGVALFLYKDAQLAARIEASQQQIREHQAQMQNFTSSIFPQK